MTNQKEGGLGGGAVKRHVRGRKIQRALMVMQENN